MTQKEYNIGVLTPPIESAGIIPLSNLIEILKILSSNLYLITGGNSFKHFKKDTNIFTYEIKFSKGKTIIMRILKYIYFNIDEASKILKFLNGIDCLMFFFSAEFQLIPILTAKLFRKKTIIIMTGSSIKTLEAKNDMMRHGLVVLRFFTLLCADKIVLYSNKLVEEFGLNKWEKKIIIAHEHFLDFNNFTVTNPLSNRPHLIGYIGRLSEEKGVKQFIKALPTILKDNQNLHAFIGGDGELKGAIETSLQEEKITDRVDLIGWISHDDLPKYLNQLRLLVIPSYTEGLPNIMLEAMACGTPVIATPVGAIPDIIIDGKTGFIMEDNSPECIAKNVIRALNSQKMQQIAKNGREVVEENFTFEKTVKDWKLILQNIE